MNISLAILAVAVTSPALPPIILPPTPPGYVLALESRVDSLKAALDDCLAETETKAETTARKFRVYGSMRTLLAKMPKEHTKPTRFDPVNFDAINGWLADMRGQVFESTLTCVAADDYSAQFDGAVERVGTMSLKLRIVASLRQPGQTRTLPVKLGQTYRVSGVIGGTGYDPTTGYNPMTYTIALFNCEVRPAPRRS